MPNFDIGTQITIKRRKKVLDESASADDSGNRYGVFITSAKPGGLKVGAQRAPTVDDILAVPAWQLAEGLPCHESGLDYCAEIPRGRYAKERETARMALAMASCEACPVKAECLEAASPADRHWTVRGGLLPGALDPDATGRVAVARGGIVAATGVCWNGLHDITLPGAKHPDGHCIRCRRAADSRYQERRRLAKAAA